jgi:hypothetical protein
MSMDDADTFAKAGAKERMLKASPSFVFVGQTVIGRVMGST